jgi:hypothetical protein
MAKKKKHMKKCSASLAINKNANQNHVKIPPHSCYNGYHKEHHQKQMLVRMWGKRNPHTL